MTLRERDELLDKLGGAISRASNGRAKLDRLDDDARIIEDVGLSSLDLLDLRYEVDSIWQMTITDDEVAQLRTIGDVVRLIEQRASARQGP
jgi:acyl carrier protein